MVHGLDQACRESAPRISQSLTEQCLDLVCKAINVMVRQVAVLLNTIAAEGTVSAEPAPQGMDSYGLLPRHYISGLGTLLKMQF